MVDMADPPVIAAKRLTVRYTGKEAHASSFPERGINAADALTVAQVAIGLIRQHIRQSDRIHGIVTKGGDAPNVVPAHTEASYSIRADTLAHLESIEAKAMRCFEAGAVATGAPWKSMRSPFAYSELRSDADLAAAYRRNGEELGRLFIDRSPAVERAAGSTDMGNVSLVDAGHPPDDRHQLPARREPPAGVRRARGDPGRRQGRHGRRHRHGLDDHRRRDGREGAPAPTGRQHRVSQGLGRTET